MRYEVFNFESFRSDPRFARFYGTAGAQPSWVLKYAILAALLVLSIPIIALVLLVMLTFVVVFFFLALVNGLLGLLRPRSRDLQETGRRNVRVIRSDP